VKVLDVFLIEFNFFLRILKVSYDALYPKTDNFAKNIT
jgi:hypothetical protein